MRLFLTIITLMQLSIFASQENLPLKNRFWVLCYHDVVDRIVDPNLPSITTAQLISHFEWLKRNGYSVVSIDDILAAKAGRRDLPKKSVLLMFDDGYKSFYTRIFPLLKLYNYHAVFALVGKWQETPMGEEFSYGTIKKPRSLLLSWSEVREMMDSGLVEIASHGYDAHYGIISNPQNNTRPFYNTLMYKDGRYESEDEYIRRVEADIKRSSDTLLKYTGKRPRIIVWPYGAYNSTVVKIAKKYGMAITASLDDGQNGLEDIGVLKRFLIGNDADLGDFIWSVKPYDDGPKRALFVDIDEIYDPDSKITEERLGRVLDTIKRVAPTDVFVKGYSDSDGDGVAEALYFPNSSMPMRADLLGRVVWQIKSRTGYTRVHVQMPLDSFELGAKSADIALDRDKDAIKDIYLYMAKYTFFHGLAIEWDYNKKYEIKKVSGLIDDIQKGIERFSMRHTLSLVTQRDGIEGIKKRAPSIFGRFDFIVAGVKRGDRFEAVVRNFENDRHKVLIKFDDDGKDEAKVSKNMYFLSIEGIMNFGYERGDYCDWNATPEFMKSFSLNYDPFVKM